MLDMGAFGAPDDDRRICPEIGCVIWAYLASAYGADGSYDG